MREPFMVGVFDNVEYPKRKPNAYTRDYNRDWPGCCVHHVYATSGAEAKKAAIREHVGYCRKEVKP